MPGPTAFARARAERHTTAPERCQRHCMCSRRPRMRWRCSHRWTTPMWFATMSALRSAAPNSRSSWSSARSALPGAPPCSVTAGPKSVPHSRMLGSRCAANARLCKRAALPGWRPGRVHQAACGAAPVGGRGHAQVCAGRGGSALHTQQGRASPLLPPQLTHASQTGPCRKTPTLNTAAYCPHAEPDPSFGTPETTTRTQHVGGACMPQGLIHRDLKASNLLLSSGTVKLGDFGISRALAPHESAAKTMVGTPYYMSPEILKARACTLFLRHGLHDVDLACWVTVASCPPHACTWQPDAKHICDISLKQG